MLSASNVWTTKVTCCDLGSSAVADSIGTLGVTAGTGAPPLEPPPPVPPNVVLWITATFAKPAVIIAAAAA